LVRSCSFANVTEVKVSAGNCFAGVAYLAGDTIELIVESDVLCVYLLSDFELLFGSSSDTEICLFSDLQDFLEKAGDKDGGGRVRATVGVGGLLLPCDS
jgi:hypothetical protein